jgi:transcriptional regulator with XRE-family HTH domain
MDFIEEMLDRDPKAREAFEREGHVDSVYRKILEKLVIRRKERMTQAEVAEKMGVSQPRVACLETMKEPFNLRTFIEYAEIVGADVSVEARPEKQAPPPRQYAKDRGVTGVAHVVKEARAKIASRSEIAKTEKKRK